MVQLGPEAVSVRLTPEQQLEMATEDMVLLPLLVMEPGGYRRRIVAFMTAE